MGSQDGARPFNFWVATRTGAPAHVEDHRQDTQPVTPVQGYGVAAAPSKTLLEVYRDTLTAAVDSMESGATRQTLAHGISRLFQALDSRDTTLSRALQEARELREEHTLLADELARAKDYIQLLERRIKDQAELVKGAPKIMIGQVNAATIDYYNGLREKRKTAP